MRRAFPTSEWVCVFEQEKAKRSLRSASVLSAPGARGPQAAEARPGCGRDMSEPHGREGGTDGDDRATRSLLCPHFPR